MPEQTIGTAWLGDAAGNKKYAHSVTSAVYDPESGQTLDAVIHPTYGSTEWAPTGEFWIDGKPIYRKVITGTITTDSPLDNSIDSLISYSGNGYINSTGASSGALIGIPCLAGNVFTATIYTNLRWYITKNGMNGQLNDAKIVVVATLK